MKNLKAGFIVAVLVALAVLFYLQHQMQDKLRAENVVLAQQLAQVQTDNESLSNRLAAAGDANSLSAKEHNELVKLRGEVGLLRRQTNELGKLRGTLADLRKNAQSSGESVSIQEQEKQIAIAKMTDAKSFALGFIMYAGDNHGRFPTNWDQISSYTNQYQPTGSNDFEIINQGPLNADELGANGSSIILIKSPAWLTSNGKWVKAYAFADGHSEIKAEPAEGFDAYEQQHVVSPP